MPNRKRPPVAVFIIPLFIGLLGFSRVTQSPQFDDQVFQRRGGAVD